MQTVSRPHSMSTMSMQDLVDRSIQLPTSRHESRNQEEYTRGPLSSGIEPDDLQLNFEAASLGSLAIELAKIQQTVNSTSHLVSDFIWLQQTTKPNMQSESNAMLSAGILPSLKKIEDHILNQPRQASANGSDSASLNACLHTMEKLFAKQDERLRESFQSLMEPSVDRICRVIEEAVGQGMQAELQRKSTSPIEALLSEIPATAGVMPENESLQPGKAGISQSVQRVSKLNFKGDENPHLQQAKCRDYILKMSHGGRGMAHGLTAYLRSHNLMPPWAEKLIHRFHRFRSRKKHGVACRRQLLHFIDGGRFGLLSFILIALNVAWMGYAANSEMQKFLQLPFGSEVVNPDVDLGEKWYNTVEFIFAVVFACECLLRFVAEGPGYFFFGDNARFNLLDVVVVLFSFFQLYLDTVNLGYLRLCRILRIARLLRPLRLISGFADLRAMLVMTMSSFSLLVWAGLICALWILIMSIALMETLVSSANLENGHSQAVINKYYGNLADTMWTLLQIACAGELWGNISREAGPELRFVQIMIFVFVVPLLFVLFPVVYAYYCFKVFHLQKHDLFLAMQRREKEAENFLLEMRELLHMVDVPLHEHLDVEKLQTLFQDKPRFAFFLETAGISGSPEELMTFFCGSDDDKFTMREFIAGCQWFYLESRDVDTVFVSEQIAALKDETTRENDRLAVEIRARLKTVEESLKEARIKPAHTNASGLKSPKHDAR